MTDCLSLSPSHPSPSLCLTFLRNALKVEKKKKKGEEEKGDGREESS